MMKRLLILLLLTSPAVLAQTRYVDFVGGSDAFDGTAKTHTSGTVGPWKSSPYMQSGAGCSDNSGTHLGYSHTAGQQIIFKGGVTWPRACFQMSIPAGGTSGNIDYYGVDLTWFTGGGFTRPLFDMAQGIPTGNHVIVVTSAFPGFTTFDNFEIANQGLSLGISNADDAFNFINVTGAMPSVLVENMNMHDWISNTDVAGQSTVWPWPYSAGCVNDGHNRITMDRSTCEGSASWVFASGVKQFGSYSGACVNCKEVKNSTFHHTGAACFTPSSCHDNEMYNISQTIYDLCPCRPHSQVIEDDFGDVTNVPVYNNSVHDNNPVGVAIYMNPTAYIYNNVMWNNGSAAITIGRPGNGYSNFTAVGYVLNNTVDCSNGTSCFRVDNKGNIPNTVNLENNHWITNGAPLCVNSTGVCSAITTFNQIKNLLINTAQATTNGYTIANKYKAFPAPGPTSTVAFAVNLTTIATGSLAALAKDVECTLWYGAATCVARPTGSTAWDAGAYQSPGSGGGTPPTVTVTQPAAGTISGSVTITVTASGGTVSSIQPLVDGNTFGNACTTSPCNVLWDTTKTGNGAHTVGGTATNGTGQGTATPVAVTVNNNAPGCATSGASWTATSFTTQAGAFTATLTITPNGVPGVGTGGPVVALSQGPMAAFTDGATLIRQSDNGFWEVYNQALPGYTHQTAVSWIVGTTATFTWSVDGVGQTASVHVTQGGVTSTLATGYTFRAAATSLSYWNLSPTVPTLTACAFTLGATGALTPASFNFGVIQVGNTASQVFTLTNNGGSPLTVSAYAASPSVYSIPTNTCVSPIAAAGTCAITVQFAPTSPTSYPGTLHLTTTGTINDSTLSGAGSSISAPSVPLGLTATVNGTTIALSWTASTGTAPITYSVLSSTTNGGPYASLATGLTSTSYSDTNLVNGSHYYVVNATNAAGTSANSAQATGVVSVTPQVNLSPASLAFGNVRLGASGSLNETVANVGNANLVFNTPAISPISGPNAADFTFGSGCTDGSSVTPASSCSFLVTFTPSTTGTQEQGTLCTSSNSPTNPDCVTLNGTGVAAVTVLPATLSFGNIFVGKSSASQTVTFTNQSGATVTFSSIALTTGTNYAIGTNTCGGSVADGASCTVQITFTPLSVGTLTDTLTFTDSAAGSPHTVSLTGNGKTHHILKVGSVV